VSPKSGFTAETKGYEVIHAAVDEGPSGTRTHHPATCPRGFAAPSPARLATDCPHRPPRGFAARRRRSGAYPVCEHRSAATAQSAGRIAWRRRALLAGARRGRGWEPSQGSMTIVGRRSIEEPMKRCYAGSPAFPPRAGVRSGSAPAPACRRGARPGLRVGDAHAALARLPLTALLRKTPGAGFCPPLPS